MWIDKRIIFLEKFKGWLEREEISEPILVPQLKLEISGLVSSKIVRKGRPFSDGVFIKQLLKKNLATT